MAEGDAIVMNHFLERLLYGDFNLSTDSLKIALCNAYAQSVDGNNGYANLTGEITAATNYSAGGKALTGASISQDDTNDRAVFDAADLTWTSLGTATITDAILYDDTITTPVNKPLMIAWEIATNSNGGNYTLSFHATNGILVLAGA